MQVDSRQLRPVHRVSQSPFLEGVCAADYLIKSSVERVVYINRQVYEWGHYIEERLRGVVQGLKRSTNYVVNFEQWEELDVEKLKRDNPVILAPHPAAAAKIINELSELDMVAGKDYRLISLGNNMEYQQYNITCVVAPLEKYGLLLGELICADSFEKSLGNKISIEVAPYMVERKTFFSSIGNGALK
jgi:hypothetical protein